MIGIAEDNAICRISFAKKTDVPAILREWKKEWPETEFTRDDGVIAMFARQIDSGVLPALRMTGTPFQHAVWKALLDVPPGETVSYAELARRIRKPKAARAVGAACGANLIPLVVPCHRVLASDGTLGGFSGGLAIKRALLKAEKAA
jgi:methylated-DNA-[protein]-cysteine S-methyltransferase